MQNELERDNSATKTQRTENLSTIGLVYCLMSADVLWPSSFMSGLL